MFRELRQRVRRRRELERDRLPERARSTRGMRIDLREEPALLRRDGPWRPSPVTDIEGARVLALLGDSVTTDHISPAGSIAKDSPAGAVPGVEQRRQTVKDFNSYGSRRGNHEVMMRGTFANIRLRNRLAPGHRGRLDAASAERRADVDLRRGSWRTNRNSTPLIVLAGSEYGTGSSRDWAAKGR